MNLGPWRSGVSCWWCLSLGHRAMAAVCVSHRPPPVRFPALKIREGFPDDRSEGA